MVDKIIGVDFDNTIACYDKAFYNCALERGLIPSKIRPVKNDIRDYLNGAGKRDIFTELQGYVYGPGIINAIQFEGARDFFVSCKNKRIKTKVVSQKTKKPYLGPEYDLHKYAYEWLEKNNFFNSDAGLMREDVFFELTKEEKVRRIETEKCTYFIDDLPELFFEENFPNISKILFDPNGKYSTFKDIKIVKNWETICNILEI